jgi:hypothetical protein
MADSRDWPDIPYAPWSETRQALHLYSQIVGKYRLARTPWVNHSWHATLYVCATGLTTGVVLDAGTGIDLEFNLVDHRLVGRNSHGDRRELALEPGTVADLCRRLKQVIEQLGGTPEFHGSPNELKDSVPFAQDDRERPYDPDAVTRFHRALVLVDAVLKNSAPALSARSARSTSSGAVSTWPSPAFRDAARRSIQAVFPTSLTR